MCYFPEHLGLQDQKWGRKQVGESPGKRSQPGGISPIHSWIEEQLYQKNRQGQKPEPGANIYPFNNLKEGKEFSDREQHKESPKKGKGGELADEKG